MEVLTGEAICSQLGCAGPSLIAVTVDQFNEKTVQFSLKKFYNNFKEILELFKSIPERVFSSLVPLDIATFFWDKRVFNTCCRLLSAMKYMMKMPNFTNINQIVASQFSTSFNEIVQYFKTRDLRAAVTENIGKIRDHNKINLQSDFQVELAFLAFFTTGDLFLYMCGRKKARIVAQNFF